MKLINCTPHAITVYSCSDTSSPECVVIGTYPVREDSDPARLDTKPQSTLGEITSPDGEHSIIVVSPQEFTGVSGLPPDDSQGAAVVSTMVAE